MSFFAVNDNLGTFFCFVVVYFFDSFLKLQYYRAGGVNDFDVVFFRNPIGFRWFAMSTEKTARIF